MDVGIREMDACHTLYEANRRRSIAKLCKIIHAFFCYIVFVMRAGVTHMKKNMA